MPEPIVNEPIVNTTTEPIVTAPTTTPPVTPSIDVEDLLKKVRQDEKNKLYPEIEKLKGQLEEKTLKLNDAILLLHQRDEDIVTLNAQMELTKTEGEKSMSKTVQDLQAEIEKLTKQLTDSTGEIAKVRNEYELKDYRTLQTKDVDESVLDLVTGNTKEELDASIAKAKATYDKIASKFQTVPPVVPSVPVVPSIANSIPPVNMTTINKDVFKNMSLEELWKLDPKSPEYANLRKQLGFK